MSEESGDASSRPLAPKNLIENAKLSVVFLIIALWEYGFISFEGAVLAFMAGGLVLFIGETHDR